MSNYKVICQTAKESCVPNTTKESCNFCSTNGIPILPVRYSVIRSLIEIPYQEKNNYPTISTPTEYENLSAHKYTLRLLREGYLYLYDEKMDRIGSWQITPETKFQQFALNDTDSNGVPHVKKRHRKDENNKKFSCNNKSNHIPASMIYWPAKNRTTLWLYYSELPIPSQTLHSLTKDVAWRNKHMQSLAINNPCGPHVFSASQIPELLLENSNVPMDIFEPYPFHRDPVLGYNIGQVFSDHLQKHKKKTGETGVMLALKDDIALLETLNYDRHLPEQEFEEKVGYAPNKPIEQCTSSELAIRRKLTCYSLLNMLLEQKQAEGDAESYRYRKLYDSPGGKYTIAQEAVNKLALFDQAPLAASINELSVSTPDREAEYIQHNIDCGKKEIEDNFQEYVDIDEFKSFKSKYETAVYNKCKKLELFDKDYSVEMMCRGSFIKDEWRWLKENPTLATFSMPITLRILVGNVMTMHSQKLWFEHLLNTKAESILINTMGLHDPELIQKLTESIKVDEPDFFNEISKSKNIIKISKSLNTFISASCKSLTDETVFALLSNSIKSLDHKFEKLATFSMPSLSTIITSSKQSIRQQWLYILARFDNIRRYLRGENILHVVEITVPISEMKNLLRSLPQSASASFEPANTRNITSIKDNEGNTVNIRHKPYSGSSTQANEPKTKIYILADKDGLKDLKSFSHNGEEPYSARITQTNQKFKIQPDTGKISGSNEVALVTPELKQRLIERFKNIAKQDVQQAGHSAIALFLAGYTIYEAWKKPNDNLSDVTSLVSSVLGFARSSLSLADSGRLALATSEEAESLKLLTKMRWGSRIVSSSNIAVLACSFFDIAKAVQAYLNGEPNRVIAYLGVNAAISVTTAVLLFYPPTAPFALIIGLASVLINTLLTIWSTQPLTLAQRIWIHRGIFGIHSRNYYNSSEFGGSAPVDILAIYNNVTKKLNIRPFAEKYFPRHLTDEDWRKYHANALDEETKALALLVTGITFEVTVHPSVHNVDEYFPEYRNVQPTRKSSMTMPYITVKVSIPIDVDGDIQLKIGNKINNPTDEIEMDYFKKDGDKIYSIDNEGSLSPISRMIAHRVQSSILIVKDYNIDAKVSKTIFLSFSEKSAPYIPIAQDSIKI